MGEVIVPVIAAIEYSDVLSEVEMQELIRWERPFVIVQIV